MMIRRPGGLGAALTQRVRSAATMLSISEGQATPPVQESLELPDGERTYTMFVQTAKAGTWAAKTGEEGVYTLTLTGLPAQTVYFSDRPQRIVGTHDTTDFLEALGFASESPPNAALITSKEGEQDILVIELFDPVYTAGEDAIGATLVYDARILQNYFETNLGGVAELQSDPDAMPSRFEGASLFIDDCRDGRAWCGKWRKVGAGDYHLDQVSDAFSFGCCYRFPSCSPCNSLNDSYCTAYVPECESGDCIIHGAYCSF